MVNRGGLDAIAEIRARLNADEFKSGSEEVRRNAEQLKGVLGEVEKSFETVGKSATTSERSLESFWGQVNGNVRRADDFARAMDRFKQFEAARPDDARLPLILSDIKSKYADLGNAAEDAGKKQGGFNELMGYGSFALKAFGVSLAAVGIRKLGTDILQSSEEGREALQRLSETGENLRKTIEPLGTAITNFLIAPLHDASTRANRLSEQFREMVRDIGTDFRNAGGDILTRESGRGPGFQPPDVTITGPVDILSNVPITPGQGSFRGAAQRFYREQQAEQEARQRAIDQFRNISSPDLDARVRGQLDAGYGRLPAGAGFLPMGLAQAGRHTEQNREIEQRAEYEQRISEQIELQITYLEESNQYLTEAPAQREAELRILQMQKSAGRELTEIDKERVRLATEQRRIQEYSSAFQRQATQDFARFFDEIGENGRVSFGSLFRDLLTSFRRTLNQMAAEAIAAKIFGSKSSGGSGVGDFISSAFSALLGGGSSSSGSGLLPYGSNLGGYAGARASGGPVTAGGTYLVGEDGPELFAPYSSGTVLPSGSFGGNSIVNHVNIDARGADAGVAERLRGMVQREIAAGIAAAAPSIAGAAFGAVSDRLRNTGRGGL